MARIPISVILSDVGDQISRGRRTLMTFKTATLVAKDGEKIAVSSKYETELAPDVWVQLGPWISMKHVKLLVDAPRSVSITRRRQEKT